MLLHLGQARSKLGLGLVGDGFLSGSELSLVEQVVVLEGLHVLVKLKDQGARSRDVVRENLRFAHASKVLDDGAERVTVGDDNDALALDHLGADLVIPVWEHAHNSVLEAFRPGEHVRGKAVVSAVVPRVSLVVEVELGRRNVIAATPHKHLLFTMLLSGLGLVEPLEGAVGAFVKPPRLEVGNPEGAHLLGDRVVGFDSTLQHRGVRNVELKAVLLQQLTGLLGLLDTLGSEVDVVPAGEAVLEVPGGLTVADEDDLVDGGGSNSLHDSCLVCFDLIRGAVPFPLK